MAKHLKSNVAPKANREMLRSRNKQVVTKNPALVKLRRKGIKMFHRFMTWCANESAAKVQTTIVATILAIAILPATICGIISWFTV